MASSPIDGTECSRYIERAKNSKRAIPDGLSFEDVISGKSLPPCSLNDFMDYLVYVEHNAENLQFYLWCRDYVQRFEALPEAEKVLSPEWIPEKEEPKLENFSSNSPRTSISLKWQPFPIQPMRDEINRLIRHYLLFSSPRELNLSHHDRATVLQALQHSTHPSALFPALHIAETTLRGQAHPNFIRWSICNGNKPRIFFVRIMGISSTIFGFMIAILLTLSSASRWWRIFAALEWFLGVSMLVASQKGLCLIMHHSHVRNLRPWEQDLVDLESKPTGSKNPDDSEPEHTMRTASQTKNERDSFGSRSSLQSFGETNYWDGEWLKKYEKKSLLRKVFAKTVWIQDETLRILQDRIVLGAYIWAAICAVILTVTFVALPKGNFY